MFITPLALELARRCLVSLGAVSMPWTAESTLVSGSDMLACVGVLKAVCDQVMDESLQADNRHE